MDELTQIRNIGIIAHIDAGKTTATERMLFHSGKTHRVGSIDDGNTVMDYLDEERKRGITIVSAAATFPWQDALVHLIDTPGHIDFTAEVERSLRVIDGAVVIFSGMEGVEAQSEKVWHQAERYHLPRLAFINKLDRIGASFARVHAQINAKFGPKAIALHLPVGVEGDFHGLIDLITEQYITFIGPSGHTTDLAPIPSELVDDARLAREVLIERLADHSDDIANLFLDSTPIPIDLLKREVRRLTIASQIVPVLLGSAKLNIGIQPLLDAVVDFLPSPADIPQIPAMTAKEQEPAVLAPDPSAPFAGLIFKVVANASADLYYLRTYAGTLSVGDGVYVPRLNAMAKVKRLLRLYAKNTESIDTIGPGDIVGLIGPRDLQTGDTLCQRHQAVTFERMAFPEPVLSMALEPKTSKDKKRLDDALTLIAREDPTLHLTVDANTGQRLLSGMGELHLEISVKRITGEFNIPAKCGEPRVAYRETINAPVDVHTTFHHTMGDTELHADIHLRLEPRAKVEPFFEVVNSVRDSMVSKHQQETAMAALNDGIKTGGQSGYPLIYIRAELLGITTHGDKTTDGAILGAVLQSLNQAINEAGTHILEPIMTLDILTPESHLGDVTNDLTMRRGIIHLVTEVGDLQRIQAEVPLAEMFGFSKSLPRLTGGRGSFSMEPAGYAATPHLT